MRTFDIFDHTTTMVDENECLLREALRVDSTGRVVVWGTDTLRDATIVAALRDMGELVYWGDGGKSVEFRLADDSAWLSFHSDGTSRCDGVKVGVMEAAQAFAAWVRVTSRRARVEQLARAMFETDPGVSRFVIRRASFESRAAQRVVLGGSLLVDTELDAQKIDAATNYAWSEDWCGWRTRYMQRARQILARLDVTGGA